MKVETSTLTKTALDWAVAIALGIPREEIRLPRIKDFSLCRYLRDEDGELNGSYRTGPDLLFSSKWEAGGPIIERERIEVRPTTVSLADPTKNWSASIHDVWMFMPGPTPLIAAMRCFCASRLGDEVDVPEELL